MFLDDSLAMELDGRKRMAVNGAMPCCCTRGSGSSAAESRELLAVNRRGRSIMCAATVLPLLGVASGDGIPVRGAIVMMEDRPGADGH